MPRNHVFLLFHFLTFQFAKNVAICSFGDNLKPFFKKNLFRSASETEKSAVGTALVMIPDIHLYRSGSESMLSSKQYS